MKFIFGLGNPGMKYKKTRHNAGFMAADIIAKKLGARFKNFSRLSSKIAIADFGGETVAIVKPQTYMNNSGYAVSAVLDYYNADKSDIIVIYDDVDIAVGCIRIRKKGSAGTHNGMRNIVEYLDDNNFIRVRIGIGKTPPYKTITDHVLGKFLAGEMQEITKGIDSAAKAALCIIEEGTEKAQSKFNSV